MADLNILFYLKEGSNFLFNSSLNKAKMASKDSSFPYSKVLKCNTMPTNWVTSVNLHNAYFYVLKTQQKGFHSVHAIQG